MQDTAVHRSACVRVSVVLAAVLPLGCGSASQPSDSASSAEALSLRLETAHFRVYAGQASDATIRGVANTLEDGQPRILGDLGIASMRPVSIRVWQDERTFLDAMQVFLGQRFNATGYITGPEELRVLAVPRLEINSTHELCHAASLYVNPAFANNPRWFWETVALYENREFVHPRTLSYLANGAAFPTLSQLNADPNSSQRIYDLGYVLGEFIVSRVGQPGFLDLIRRNGDTVSVMGLSDAAFEAAFAEFVRARYLS